MQLGSRTCWFQSLSVSSIGVQVDGDGDLDGCDVGAGVVKNVVENLGYYIRLNDETMDPFTEQTEPAKLLFSFLENLPVLGNR